MNRIVVTGGNGFIGRYLLKKLSSCNLDSTVLISNTRNIHGDDLQHITTFHNSSLKFYTADIRDKKSICEIFRTEKADTCIHLAAKVGLRDSIKNPSETMDINVNGTLNVLKACHRYNVNNFVFASTAAVYGDAKELPIREDHILEPLSPYGNSKKLAEQYVNSFKKLKKIKNAVILRIFNPYGHGNANDPDVVTKFALSLKRKLPPIIYGNGNQTRDFISVDDIVDSILLSIDAMENTDKAKEDKKSILDSESIFNIGTGRSISINELVNKMISISGLDLQPIYEKSSEIVNDVTHSYADISRSEKILHFVAKKRIETGVKEVMEKVCIE